MTEELTRCMIDIETLGLEPGSVVLSIGAVKFGPGEVGEKFYKNIDLQSSVDAGLEIDADTLQWWFDETDEEARDCLYEGDESLRDSLAILRIFFEECDEVWANSPAMDCSVLEEAYDAVGIEEPWEYDEERDLRTLEALPGVEVPEVDEGIEHNALDDARAQAEVAADILAQVENSDEPKSTPDPSTA